MLGGLQFGVLFLGLFHELFHELFGVLGIVGGVVVGGVAGGVAGGMETGGKAVVMHYILHLFLALHHFLPLHLIPFLEAMRERILIQRAGAHYRFIHRTVQEHIAALTDERIETLAVSPVPASPVS